MPVKAVLVDDLWFSYGGDPVFQGATFSIEEGDFAAIIGPNGGGKTTLMRLCLGLLTPQKGVIRVLGHPPSEARRDVGYVSQDLHILLSFPVSVLDVVLMGLLPLKRLGERFSSSDKERALTMLEGMGIASLAGRPVGALSGGQRQRVFVARALVAEPGLLFLDEPTAAMDPIFQEDLFAFMERLNSSRGTTVVVITHDIGAISTHVRSVVCVGGGKVFCHGGGTITPEMLDAAYQCPVDLIAHGVPHRLFKEH
jgi:zinc transport system ATP-binding protein